MNSLLTRAHGLMYVNAENFLTVSSSEIKGHAYKLYKPTCSSTVRHNFFANRVVNGTHCEQQLISHL